VGLVFASWVLIWYGLTGPYVSRLMMNAIVFPFRGRKFTDIMGWFADGLVCSPDLPRVPKLTTVYILTCSAKISAGR
jgi:hypothetical protein